MSVVNDTIQAFHELVEQRGDDAAALLDWVYAEQRKRRVTYRTRDIPTALRPQFLTAEQTALMSSTVETLSACLEKIVSLYVKHPEVRSAIPFLPEEEELICLPDRTRKNVVVSRLDAFIIDDCLNYLEFNTDSPASVAWTEEHQEVFKELPVMRQLADRFRFGCENTTELLCDALLEAYAESGLTEPPRVVITDWLDVNTTPEFDIVRDALERRGVPTVIADTRDLEYTGGKLRAGDFYPSLVYRRVIWRELVERREECRPILDAARDGAVCVVNPFRAKVAGSKACLSFMCDPANARHFTSRELDAISKHVPWTCVLGDEPVQYRGRTVDPYELAVKEREHLVLKPLHGYGGKGEALGNEMDQSAWEEVLRGAEAGSWCIQEFSPIPEEQFPMFTPGLVFEPRKLNLNPFAFGGKYAGCFTRYSKSSIINVSSGGGMIPTFTVTRT